MWGFTPNLQTVADIFVWKVRWCHYIDAIMTTMASQITSLTVVYSTVYSDVDQRKHQSSASLAFVCGIHRGRWQRASYAENVSIWWRWSLTLFWRRRTDTVRNRYDRVGLYRLAKYTSWLARPRSQLHCVIFVGSLFVHFVACRLGMAAGGPLWCCCPGAFGRGHASMARSGVGDHGFVGICGCPIRAALGWGTAVVVPVLAATTTCPVAWVRFHCCFIVIFFFFQICLSV